MTWIYIISGYLICVIICLVAWVKSAPMGYEDKSGFHYGEKNEKS